VSGAVRGGSNCRAAGPIKIGAILPLTGSGASYGVWMKGGTEIAAEEINASGGIAGRKLEVIYEDHAADVKRSAMRRLVEVEKVPFTLTCTRPPGGAADRRAEQGGDDERRGPV
jgi:branched-chain amino acid transport system substrate-binding protein